MGSVLYILIMNISETILSAAGVLISTLIMTVGYLTNRQLQRVDDKVSKIDDDFLETKSKMLEIATIDKLAIIEHLQREIMPHLKNKSLDDQIAKLTSEIVFLKEYQRNKIGPAIEEVLSMTKVVSEQESKQKESDLVLQKMFEVVKKLVERKV